MIQMKITPNKLAILFLSMTFFVSSCQKEMDEATDLNSGKGKVTLKLSGARFKEPTNDKDLQSSANRKGSVSSSKIQYQEIPFNDDYMMSAALTPVGEISSSLRASARANAVSKDLITEPLEEGTPYTISVYEKGNRDNLIASKNFIHGVDDKNIEFELESGEYTFVANATKKYYQKQWNSNFQEWQETSDWSSPHWHEDIVVESGESKPLDIVLNNAFAEITVSVNSGDLGIITRIGGGNFSPTYSSYPFASSSVTIDDFTGEVTYGGMANSFEMFTFPFTYTSHEPSSLWVSNPAPLRLDYSDKGTVSISGIIINNKMGSVSISDLEIEEGVKYHLELSLMKKPEEEEKTFKVGSIEFAKSNLWYDIYTQKYYFRGTSLFFPGFVKPLVNNPSYPQPGGFHNGTNGDPCKLVEPFDTWRLPTQMEIEQIMFPAFNISTPYTESQNTYYDYYGVHFGTRQSTSNESSSYLNLVCVGYGNSAGYVGYEREKDRYLLSTIDGGYTQLILSPPKASDPLVSQDVAGNISGPGGQIEIVNFEQGKDIAIAVRCVKNN